MIDEKNISVDIAESENIEIITKNSTETKSKKICDVLYFNKYSGIISVDFDGIQVQTKTDKKEIPNTVTVKYSGKVGTGNFKIAIE